MDLTEGNQPKTMENLGSQPQKKEVIEPGKLRVIKRNGSVVNFDLSKIDVAITKAFLAVHTSAAAASSSLFIFLAFLFCFCCRFVSLLLFSTSL